MTPVEILKGARELISNRAQWTTGERARDKYGYSVHPHSMAAVCWCANGAVEKIGHRFATPTVWNTLQDAAGSNSIVRTNDMHGHPATIAMFDRAIAHGEAT